MRARFSFVMFSILVLSVFLSSVGVCIHFVCLCSLYMSVFLVGLCFCVCHVYEPRYLRQIMNVTTNHNITEKDRFLGLHFRCRRMRLTSTTLT